MPHVTDGEATKWWILRVRLHTHWFAGDKLDDAGIARLDELGGLFDSFARSAIDLLKKLREFTGNMGSMAIKDRSISGANLTRVVEDDDLSIEGRSLLRRVILGVRSDITAADIFDRDVPKEEKAVVLHLVTDIEHSLHVKTDVVTRKTFHKLLVVHLDGLDFSGDVGGGESDHHSGLDGTSLDTTDGNCSDTTNLVDVLEGKTEWLVGRTSWRLDGVDGIEQGLAFDRTTLDLLGPALVPCHAIMSVSLRAPIGEKEGYELAGFLQHVVTVPPRDGYKRDSLGVVADLFDERRCLLHDFVEAILTPLEYCSNKTSK